MTLLINGCSFATYWNPSVEFVKNLNCDSVTNIAKVGTGSQRVLRSTIEWIAQKGNPEFVIVAIPLHSRWEMSIGKHDDDIDGTWMSLQHPEYLDQDNISDQVSFTHLQNTIKNYYTLIPNIRTEWDKLFTEILALSGFLTATGIKHLFFDMCNNFEIEHIKGYKGFSKIKLLEKNKSIIDIFGFCANKHMHEHLPENEKNNTNQTMHHHGQSSYSHLENYILDYLNSNLN